MNRQGIRAALPRAAFIAVPAITAGLCLPVEAAPFAIQDPGTGGITLKIDFVLSHTAFASGKAYTVECGLDVQFQGGQPTDSAEGFSAPTQGGGSGSCSTAMVFSFSCSGSGTFQAAEQYEIQVFDQNGNKVRERHEPIYLPGQAYPTWHCSPNPITAIVYRVKL